VIAATAAAKCASAMSAASVVSEDTQMIHRRFYVSWLLLLALQPQASGRSEIDVCTTAFTARSTMPHINFEQRSLHVSTHAHGIDLRVEKINSQQNQNPYVCVCVGKLQVGIYNIMNIHTIHIRICGARSKSQNIKYTRRPTGTVSIQCFFFRFGLLFCAIHTDHRKLSPLLNMYV